MMMQPVFTIDVSWLPTTPNDTRSFLNRCCRSYWTYYSTRPCASRTGTPSTGSSGSWPPAAHLTTSSIQVSFVGQRRSVRPAAAAAAAAAAPPSRYLGPLARLRVFSSPFLLLSSFSSFAATFPLFPYPFPSSSTSSFSSLS